MIEDYLSVLDSLVTIAGLLDGQIDKKIEEIPTDFTDGSIPFTEGGFLTEDNVNLYWDSVNNILNSLNIVVGNLIIAQRLVQGNVTITEDTVLSANDVVFCDTTNNTIKVTFEAGTDGQHLKIANCGENKNNVTVYPDGDELIYGETSMFLRDGENIDLNYSSEKGWY